MSQEFYSMPDGSFAGLYVNKVSAEALEEFNDKDENPIVLQKFISKAYEVRYTVVGNDHHVCRIDSQKSLIANIDWRKYDIANTPHYAISPPDEIKIKVNQLLEKLGLEFGALDFVVSPDGTWHFLEVNPMGQWLWIEDLTSLKISDSIVNWLSQ